MTNQLEFMDCPHCSKRIPTRSKSCYRCGKEVDGEGWSKAVEPSDRKRRKPASADLSDGPESHMAATHGGYDQSVDEFDYDDFIEQEFGEKQTKRQRPWWWYVAWVVLFIAIAGVVLDLVMAISLATRKAKAESSFVPSLVTPERSSGTDRAG